MRLGPYLVPVLLLAGCSDASAPSDGSAGHDAALFPLVDARTLTVDADATSSQHPDARRVDARLPDAHGPTDARPTDAAPRDAGPGDATLVDAPLPHAEASLSDAAADAIALPATTTITIHYPVPAGHRLTIRGSGASLDWTAGTTLTPSVDGGSGKDNIWTLSLPLSAPLQIKPLYDDTTWAIGPNWVVTPGVALDVWPHFFTNNGTITEIDNWYSHTLDNSRTLWVYLPPSAAENPDERFPVAYFQDGQNDFYADLSFSGVAWNLQGAMDNGAADGTIHEAIVIGIANAGDNRTWEYTPTPSGIDGGMAGGGAPLYLTFVATELKPQMDLQFPTEPDRAHTALCGSSLGGLVSLYGGLTRGDVFGLIGALSPSTWWDNEWIVGQVLASVGAPVQPVRIYLDSGNAGVFAQPDPWPAQANYDDWTQTVQLDQAYQKTGDDLDYLVQDGGQHNETYWAERVPGTLAFLFGPR